MSPQVPVSAKYRIEISGWDLAENFFVEKTNLDWSEEDGKRVYLRRPLRDGAVVFVRLIAPTALVRTFPVAHRVEKVSRADGAEMWEVRLVQMHPRFGAPDARRSARRDARMQGGPLSSAAPDRLSTWEEVRQATATSPEEVFALCPENSLLRQIWAVAGKLAELSADELEPLVPDSEPNDPLLN
jgi:hypothetical protein